MSACRARRVFPRSRSANRVARPPPPAPAASGPGQSAPGPPPCRRPQRPSLRPGPRLSVLLRLGVSPCPRRDPHGVPAGPRPRGRPSPRSRPRRGGARAGNGSESRLALPRTINAVLVGGLAGVDGGEHCSILRFLAKRVLYSSTGRRYSTKGTTPIRVERYQALPQEMEVSPEGAHSFVPNRVRNLGEGLFE